MHVQGLPSVLPSEPALRDGKQQKYAYFERNRRVKPVATTAEDIEAGRAKVTNPSEYVRRSSSS